MILNGIGIQFTVLPKGINKELYMGKGTKQMRFDISRQIDAKKWYKDGNIVQKIIVATMLTQDELPNDDPDSGETDESKDPNDNDHFYVIDTPGLDWYYPVFVPHDAEVRRMNSLEFVRVSFNGNSPEGNHIAGSRCSEKSEKSKWHSSQYLIKDGNYYVRFNEKEGKKALKEEKGWNDIGKGWITLGDLIDPPKDKEK